MVIRPHGLHWPGLGLTQIGMVTLALVRPVECSHRQPIEAGERIRTMLLLLVLHLVGIQADDLGPGDHTRSLTWTSGAAPTSSTSRQSYDGSKPVPVVLVFHGGGSNAEQMVPLSAA